MDLLTTGEVARMLGTSRQHVVDLCDRGVLPSVRVGTHRRIDRLAVQSFLSSPSVTGGLRPEELSSLWLHHAVAGELVKDPERVLAHARRNLATMSSRHPEARRWLGAWRRILDGGPRDVLQILTSADPLAVELRQNSPFAGTLSQAARKRVLASVRAHRGAAPGR